MTDQTDNSHRTALLGAFTRHPATVGESYWQHMAFAFGVSFRLFRAAGAAFVHGVVPACCETAASREIKTLHARMTSRH